MSSPSDIPALPPIPTPVTFERLRALLEPDGYVAQDQVLRRQLGHAEMAVSLPTGEGTVLLVSAVRIGTPLALERQPDLEAFVNDWHRERIWPTLVLGSTDSALTLHAHVGVDATAGLTDAQLSEYLRIGVGTTQQCFTTLDVPQP